MIDADTRTWYTTVRYLTEQLVNINSVSPSTQENRVAQRIHELLIEDDMTSAYTWVTQPAISEDPYQRKNVSAFLPGKGKETIILLGHFDTVGIEDYGINAPLACDPASLMHHIHELLDGKVLPHAHHWMFGRGALDMKSGVAVNIAIMRHFAHMAQEQGEILPCSLLFIATPDEERESAGARSAIQWLSDLRKNEHLRYIGLINTDYIAPRYPGDPERPVYIGSIGKVLPLFYVVGKTCHVGEPFQGVDANIMLAEVIRDISMNLELCETVDQEKTPPPVTLHQGDLKTLYNTQLPFTAWCYINLLTMRKSPAVVMEQLTEIVAQAGQRAVQRLAAGYQQIFTDSAVPQHLQRCVTFTFAELLREATGIAGTDRVTQVMSASRGSGQDLRQITLAIIEELWTLTGQEGPAIIVAFAPPYYPPVVSSDGPFIEAVRRVGNRYAHEGIVVKKYFPLLSDLSYMAPGPREGYDVLIANMPAWERTGNDHVFSAVEEAGIEGIVNIGVYGEDGHQKSERVYMPFSFEVVPRLVEETIHEVCKQV